MEDQFPQISQFLPFQGAFPVGCFLSLFCFPDLPSCFMQRMAKLIHFLLKLCGLFLEGFRRHGCVLILRIQLEISQQ